MNIVTSTLIFRCQHVLIRFILILILSGCTASASYSSLQNFQIIRLADSNDNHFIRVDIAFFYDDDVIEHVLPSSALEWFDKRNSYLNFDKNRLDVRSYEPVPLTMLLASDIPDNKKQSKKVMLYVAYYSQKKYFSFDVTYYHHLHLILSDVDAYPSEKPVNIERK